MGLQQFERRLERLVEGVFAKAFRSGLQPLELGRRITREMDLARSVGVKGTQAPNAFTVELSPADTERFASFADTLAHDLADLAKAHAAEAGYRLIGPVTVELSVDDRRATGTFAVHAAVVEGEVTADARLLLPGGQSVVIAEAATVGRNGDCDVVLEDPSVSRHHAAIRHDAGRWVVEDLGSRNGTRVNGAGVREQELRSGDRIALGDTTIVFETR